MICKGVFYSGLKTVKRSITFTAPFCKDKNRSRSVQACKVIPRISEESSSTRLQSNDSIQFLYDKLPSQVSQPHQYNLCKTILVLAIMLPTQHRKKWGLFTGGVHRNSKVVIPGGVSVT